MRREVLQTVARCSQKDDGDWKLGQVLLVLEALVDRDESVIACTRGSLQKLAILEAIPSKTPDGIDLVADDRCAKGSRNRFIQK